MQHVISKDRFEVCANCGRILYLPEVRATGVRAGEADPKFLLSRFSTAKLMIPSLKAMTPEEAMRELCGALAKEKVIADPESVVAAAVHREGILTTAVGHGLAFPHMRGVEEGVLTFAAGVSPAGIEWGGERVNLVFFTVLPVVASPFYLKLIAAIAKTFEDEEKLPFVLAAGYAKALWKELDEASDARPGEGGCCDPQPVPATVKAAFLAAAARACDDPATAERLEKTLDAKYLVRTNGLYYLDLGRDWRIAASAYRILSLAEANGLRMRDMGWKRRGLEDGR